MAKGAEDKKRKSQIVWLIVALIVVIVSGVLFVGAVSGWFAGTPKVVIDEGDRCGGECPRVFADLTREDYENKVSKGDSFVLFVDQGGCHTADRLREFVLDWSVKSGVQPYRMMFGDVKECSAHEYVKYYPSVVVVSRGIPVAWLRADEDEDSDAYNFADAFETWIGKYFD